MKKLSTLRLIVSAAALAGALGSTPATAAVRVYVTTPPPPLVVETRPAPPGRRHVWIGGYHEWDGHGYVWRPGHWELPPRHRARWVSGHWRRHGRHGWYWVDGHWR